MYNQFQNVLKIGPLNKVMGMSGMVPDYLIPKSGDDESTRRLRVFLYIMDSMTAAELDGRVDWKNWKSDEQIKSRIRRIAAGSGRHPTEVQLLLQTHQQMESFVGKMGKANKQAANPAMQRQMAAQMRRNPNLINQRLNQLDPRLIEQMGGRENVMKIMQEVAMGGNASPEAQQAAMQAMMAGGGLPGMTSGLM